MNTKRVTGGSKWSRTYIDVVGAALIATVTMASAATPPADDKPQGADLSEADMADASPADITRDVRPTRWPL